MKTNKQKNRSCTNHYSCRMYLTSSKTTENSKPKKQKQKEEDSWLLTDVHQLLETGAAVNFEDLCGSSEGMQGRNIAAQFSRQFRTGAKVMTDCIENKRL